MILMENNFTAFIYRFFLVILKSYPKHNRNQKKQLQIRIHIIYVCCMLSLEIGPRINCDKIYVFVIIYG